MSSKTHKNANKGKNKGFAGKRTMNPAGGMGSQQQNTGAHAAFQEHDPSNRMGSFEGKGEHARTGNRGHQ